MTNIYRLNKLNNKELEKVVGGSIYEVIHKFECALGLCNTQIMVDIVTYSGKDTDYKECMCPICGRHWYFRYDAAENLWRIVDKEAYLNNRNEYDGYRGLL